MPTEPEPGTARLRAAWPADGGVARGCGCAGLHRRRDAGAQQRRGAGGARPVGVADGPGARSVDGGRHRRPGAGRAGACVQAARRHRGWARSGTTGWRWPPAWAWRRCWSAPWAAPILQALGQPAALVSQATLVIGLIGLSAWPALVGLVCGGLLETIGRARTWCWPSCWPTWPTSRLNQWLIFGGLGVPPWARWGRHVHAGGAPADGRRPAGRAVARWGTRPEGAAYGLRQRFDRQAWQAGAEQRRRGAPQRPRSACWRWCRSACR
jgi:hypothetical protein